VPLYIVNLTQEPRHSQHQMEAAGREHRAGGGPQPCPRGPHQDPSTGTP